MAKGNRRPIARRHKARRRRRESGGEHSLPLQRPGRRLAVATAIFDGKAAAVGKAGTQCDVRYLGVRRPLQQLAPRTFETDIAKHGAGRLAEKGQKLPLQRPAGNAGDSGQFRDRPAAPDIRMHRIERAPNAARQQRCSMICPGRQSSQGSRNLNDKSRIAAKKFSFRIAMSQTG